MSISVREALKLDCFEGVKLIAGQSGLDRMINRVSVLESPDLDDFILPWERAISIFQAFAVKDDTKAQMNTVKMLVGTNSSGLCLIDLYMNDLCPK